MRLMKIKVIILFLMIICTVQSQFREKISDSRAFHLDAVVFKSDKGSDSRLDVYALIPYETLMFEPFEEQFVAKFKLDIHIYSSDNEKLFSRMLKKKVIVDDYYTTQGGTGKFAILQEIFEIPEGNYKLKVNLIDGLNNQEYERSRNLVIVDYNKFDFAISGLLLVSSIEEREGRFIITPHISDNIGSLENGFFIFFEAYNKRVLDSAAFYYQVLDEDDEEIFKSDIYTKDVSGEISRHYIRVPYNSKFGTGSFVLKLNAAANDTANNEMVTLAAAQRTLNYIPTFGNNIRAEIDKAIKQLRFIASQKELEFIEEGATDAEKQLRFDEFWKSKDPSPNTERNEAFEQFYARIDFANKNFKSYNEGWLTDKGHVYIVHGSPHDVERFEDYSTRKIYEKWIYGSTNEFIFVDNNGFGDFRLIRPYMVTEKYEYE